MNIVPMDVEARVRVAHSMRKASVDDAEKPKVVFVDIAFFTVGEGQQVSQWATLGICQKLEARKRFSEDVLNSKLEKFTNGSMARNKGVLWTSPETKFPIAGACITIKDGWRLPKDLRVMDSYDMQIDTIFSLYQVVHREAGYPIWQLEDCYSSVTVRSRLQEKWGIRFLTRRYEYLELLAKGRLPGLNHFFGYSEQLEKLGWPAGHIDVPYCQCEEVNAAFLGVDSENSSVILPTFPKKDSDFAGMDPSFLVLWRCCEGNIELWHSFLRSLVGCSFAGIQDVLQKAKKKEADERSRPPASTSTERGENESDISDTAFEVFRPGEIPGISEWADVRLSFESKFDESVSVITDKESKRQLFVVERVPSPDATPKALYLFDERQFEEFSNGRVRRGDLVGKDAARVARIPHPKRDQVEKTQSADRSKNSEPRDIQSRGELEVLKFFGRDPT